MAGGSDATLSSSDTISTSLASPSRPLLGNRPEFGKMRSERIDQLGALADQESASAVNGKRCLLLLSLDRHEPHRWPRHRLADRRSISRTILRTSYVGFHVRGRQQPNRMPTFISSRAQ